MHYLRLAAARMWRLSWFLGAQVAQVWASGRVVLTLFRSASEAALVRLRRRQEPNTQRNKKSDKYSQSCCYSSIKIDLKRCLKEGLILQPGLILSARESCTGSKTMSAQRSSARRPLVYSIATSASLSMGTIGSTPLSRAIAFQTLSAPLEPVSPVLWLSSRPTQTTDKWLLSVSYTHLTLPTKA